MIDRSRRRFLSNLGRGGVAAALLPGIDLRALDGFRAPPLAGGDAVQDESYWRLVRAQFPLRAGLSPMNAANLCPAPGSVVEATLRAGADLDGDVSFQNRAQFDVLRETVRTRLAAYLGADADEIAIVRNTSEANGVVVNGLELGAGDEVVVSALNHPTNRVAWAVGARRHGYAVREAAFADTPADAGEILDAFRSALTPRTRVLTFTDVSNVTGVRMPTKELCALARSRGIHVHVDGAQTFGALRRDLHDLGCDSYSASAHKWLMGPKEAGVLYVRAERTAELWPTFVGVGWNDADGTGLAGAGRFATLGQQNDATHAGLAAALDFHELIGPEQVEKRTLALTTALREGLVHLDGVAAVTPGDPSLRAGVCIVRVAGVEARPLFEALYARHGIAGAPTGGLRLSPHIYNTMAEIDAAVEAVRETAAELRA